MDPTHQILTILEDSLAVKDAFIRQQLDKIRESAELLATTLAAGGKLLIFGNGGSAADAQHMAAEFINRFQVERQPLPAIALTTDTSVITSIGNDYGFDQIFSKQVQALGRAGDVALGISTSGKSPNVLRAIQTAAAQGLTTIALTGGSGDLAAQADLVFCVPSAVTARIQEAHITLVHIWCDLVERILFPQAAV
ncbi:MAG: D-sedoheptulose 7-phosphate isomerase [Desulfobacterales bacterium]